MPMAMPMGVTMTKAKARIRYLSVLKPALTYVTPSARPCTVATRSSVKRTAHSAFGRLGGYCGKCRGSVRRGVSSQRSVRMLQQVQAL